MASDQSARQYTAWLRHRSLGEELLNRAVASSPTFTNAMEPWQAEEVGALDSDCSDTELRETIERRMEAVCGMVPARVERIELGDPVPASKN